MKDPAYALEPVIRIEGMRRREDGVYEITKATLLSVGMVPVGPGMFLRAEPIFVPADAELPLPTMETSFIPTDLEVQRAVNAWNHSMTDWNGLLEPDVVDD